jgi:leucine dehydrogenase
MAVAVTEQPTASSLDHEQLIVRRGERSGLYTIVAVHTTALGPALGGCRMWSYAAAADAVSDALRLSEAMTFKAAAAGLPLGGGKGVICVPPGGAPRGELRELALRDFADTVNLLEGRYVTAEDVGTTPEDMAVIARTCAHVAGLHGGSGDPSPYTARGVAAAMRACCRHVFGSPDLAGRSVAVVGLGAVGERLARRLADAGAELVVTDIDASKRTLALELPHARWVDPDRALAADVDMLAPCALGGVLDAAAARALRCRVVCGAANNQLAGDDVADELAGRGIVYAPDFIVNAGGLINIATELDGYDPARAARRVDGIGTLVARLLAEAAAADTTPLAVAKQRARRALRAA